MQMFSKKIKLFVFMIIFFQNQIFAFEIKEAKDPNIEKKEFINIFIDKELIGSLDDFYNSLRVKTNAVINIQYIDSKISEQNAINSHPDIVITKNLLSTDFQKKNDLNQILYLGKLKYSICLLGKDLRDETKKKIHNINNNEIGLNKSFSEVIVSLESIFQIYGKIKLGYVDYLKSEKFNFGNTILIKFPAFLPLSLALKKNFHKEDKIDFAFLPQELCQKYLEDESEMILISFDQDSIKNSAQYKIFFKKEFLDIFLGKIGKNFEQLFFLKK